MKERTFLFSSPMIRAILDGRKTQTRRAIKPVPALSDGSTAIRVVPAGRGGWAAQWPPETHMEFDARLPSLRGFPCPYGAPGDLLYVKEATWIWCDARPNGTTKTGRVKVHYVPVGQHVVYCADREKPTHRINDDPRHGWRWKSARFMPKWAARTWLRSESVRVERLQDITEEDARAEGCAGGHDSIPGYKFSATPREHFRHLWSEINGADSWRANPWVWVVGFRVEVRR